MQPATSHSIEALFRSAENASPLILYLTAGDPSLEATGELLGALDRGGADLIELGVPFSDPMADGVVIQRASERALRGGATLAKILAVLPEWRHSLHAPVILFTYYNPVLQYGLERFAGDLAAAGGQGALVVDLSPEEADDYVRVMRAHRLDTIFLAAPTSTDERLQRIASLSTGFLYLISRAGVTGEQSSLSAAVLPLVRRLRKFSPLPLAVGFGLSNPDQVRQAQTIAGAAVVGSALVRAVEERYPREGAPGIEKFVRWLKSGTGSKLE